VFTIEPMINMGESHTQSTVTILPMMGHHKFTIKIVISMREAHR
jgi:methionine aminopeptidase